MSSSLLIGSVECDRRQQRCSAHRACFVMQSDPLRGLSEEQVRDRRHEYGPNVLSGERPPSFVLLVLRHVVDFLMILLLIAAGVSLGLGEYVDGAVILGIAVLNVFIGAAQEFRAEKTLEALRSLAEVKAVVTRDGVKQEVNAADLVPGDIIHLALTGSASSVPADARVIESFDLAVTETMLTGESRPVQKTADPVGDDEAEQERFFRNYVFGGCSVTKGSGTAVVVSTGMNTELGKIAASVGKKKKGQTALQRELYLVSVVLLIVGLVCAFVVFASNRFHIGNVSTIKYTATYAVALIIAIIPEELPLALTLTMVLGVRRMTLTNVVVRQMSALENLGRVTNICSDKTGTITQASMVCVRCYVNGQAFQVTGVGMQPTGQIMLGGAPVSGDVVWALAEVCGACNSSALKEPEQEGGAWQGIGQPTDVACLVFARKFGFDASRYEYLHDYPFDSALKRQTVLVRDLKTGQTLCLAKGSSESILRLCGEAALLHQPGVEEMAREGLRVIVLARKVVAPQDAATAQREELELGMEFVGMVGIQDPPRPGVMEAVEDCRRGGITVHMCTGDDVLTAGSIARQVHIVSDAEVVGRDDDVMHARDFDALTDEQLDAKADLPHVIARCTPESKVKMLKALQRRGRVCVMTGDGVNDAPAVSTADIGISMGISGSDVTRQAAHIVLSDDNFVSIVGGIREGRRIFLSIQKFVVHVLATNFGMALLLMVGLAFRDTYTNELVYPQTALEIIIENMFVLSVPLIGLIVEPPHFDVMSLPPRKSRYVLSPVLITDICVYGFFLGALALASFSIVLYGAYPGPVSSTCVQSLNATTTATTHPEVLCEPLYRARATTFLTMSFIIMFSALNNRHGYMPFWFELRLVPPVMWIGQAIVLAAIILFVYVPGLNHVVFHHTLITWELLISVGALLVYIVLATLWKTLLKHRLFPEGTAHHLEDIRGPYFEDDADAFREASRSDSQYTMVFPTDQAVSPFAPGAGEMDVGEKMMTLRASLGAPVEHEPPKGKEDPPSAKSD